MKKHKEKFYGCKCGCTKVSCGNIFNTIWAACGEKIDYKDICSMNNKKLELKIKNSFGKKLGDSSIFKELYHRLSTTPSTKINCALCNDTGLNFYNEINAQIMSPEKMYYFDNEFCSCEKGRERSQRISELYNTKPKKMRLEYNFEAGLLITILISTLIPLILILIFE